MAYILRYNTTTNGAVTFTGNTLGLSKQSNANNPGTEGSIGAFTTVNTALRDNTYPEGTTADWTLNSSAAILDIPAGSTILYAELIWAGSWNYGGENVSAFLNNAVNFTTPSGTFSISPDPATAVTNSAPDPTHNYYVRSQNVTAQVLAAGGGTYRTARVPGTQATSDNNSNHAGWTLAVAYQNPSLPGRNMSIFVGAEESYVGTVATVSGFATPPTGTLNGRLMVSAQEGDSNLVGDQLLFGPTSASLAAVSGPNNPVGNFFCSQINNDAGNLDIRGTFGSLNHTPGTNLSGRRQGWDITNIDVSARLTNNQTSAAVRGTTTGDSYMINGLGLQININAANVTAAKTADKASAIVGDVINYTIAISNTGTATANNVVITDIPCSASQYVTGSFRVNGSVVSGANPSAGVALGNIAAGGSLSVTFSVQVTSVPASLQCINQASFTYQYQSVAGGPIISGVGISSAASTAITNRPPTVPGYNVSTPENTAVNGTVVGTDPDGQTLTYSLATAPINGSAVVNSNGTWTYTPNLNFNGNDTFTVRVSDPTGGTAISTINIVVTPVNDPPTVPNYTATTLEDTPVNGTVVASDVDGDTLTYSLQNPPAHGTAVVNANGNWTYTPALNYNGPDSFTVLVSDGHGGTAVSTLSLTVIPVNDRPVVPDYTLSTPEDTILNGQVIATDPDGDPLTYSTFTSPINGTLVVNPNGTWSYTPNPNFTGTDTFSVLVSDPSGATAVSTINLTVTPVNDPPTVPDYSVTTPEDTPISGTVRGSDPDGDVLIYSLQTQAVNGTAVVNSDGTWTYTPALNYNGPDAFTVLVSDGFGGTAVSTVNITVTPVSDQIIVPNYNVSTPEETPVSSIVIAQSVDGNPLTYSLQNQASNGTAVVNADGTWTYTPVLNFNGQDAFTVVVTDTVTLNSSLSLITVTVLPVNDPPTVPDYTVAVPEDTPLNGTVVGSDIDGDPLTYSLNTPATNGTAAVNADGTWTYTPALNFQGTDSFSVLVSDGNGGTAVSNIIVTVTPVNDPPVVGNYTAQTTEDTPTNGRVAATDVDGDTLTYSLLGAAIGGTAVVNADGTWVYTPGQNYNGLDTFSVLVDDGNGGTAVSIISVAIVPVNDPPTVPNYNVQTLEDVTVNGTVVGNDVDGDTLTYSLLTPAINGTAVVNSDGTWTYTPGLNYNGSDTFSVLVNDGNGGTAVSSIVLTILPVNDPPTVPNYSTQTPEDVPVNGKVTGSDVDNMLLAYSLLTLPVSGTAVVNADGSWLYTPNPNFNGTDVFTVLVEDGSGGTAVSAINITVLSVNDPPAVGNYTATTPEDIPVNGLVVGQDIDGDILTYSLNTPASNGTAFVNADGSWTYTPHADFNGTDTFTVLVDDSHGGTAVSTVRLVILPVNDRPVVTDYAVVTAEDTPISGRVSAFDPDGDVLAYSLSALPANGTVTVNGDGAWTYIPNPDYNGPDSFSVFVDDGNGGAAISTVTVTVQPVNDAIIVPNYTVSLPEDTSVSGIVTGTNVDENPLTYSLLGPAANGTAAVNSNGSWTYTPNANFNGSDVFTVQVTDTVTGNFSISLVQLSVSPVNDPPATQNYTVAGVEDSAIDGTVVASDIDGDALTFSLNTAPSQGTAVVNPDGTWTYTPNPDFHGNDTFSVLVNDGHGGTAVSTVHVNILPVNDPPVVPDYTVSTPEETAVSGVIVAVDVDGDILVYSLFTAPTDGTVVVNPNGTWTFTPNTNFNGDDRFTVLVTDGQGGTALSVVTVTVVPVNDPPTAPDYDVSTPEDTPLVGTVVGTDIDGDILTYSLLSQAINGSTAVNANGTWTYTPNLNFNGTDTFSVLVDDGNGGTAVSTVRVTVVPVNDAPVVSDYAVTTPEDIAVNGVVAASDADGNSLVYSLYTTANNGTVTVNPDGSWVYLPNANFNGTDDFSVLVSDLNGGTAVSNIVITVLPVNDAPVVPNYTASGPEDSPNSGTVVGTDADGDLLTYSLLLTPINGTVAVNGDGTWTYVPHANFHGTDSFSVLVDDGRGGTAVSTVSLIVTPVNDAPTVPDYTVIVPEDTTISGTVVAQDVDGDNLTYSLYTPPPNGSAAVNADGSWTYTPSLNYNGPDSFSVLVTDPSGATAVSRISITVIPESDAIVVPDYTVSAVEDTPVSGQAIATDVDGNPITYSLLNPPTNGTAVVNADGTWTYTPSPNFHGTDSFGILVTDTVTGNSAVSLVTLTVAPVNDPPVVPDYTVSAPEDTSLTGTVVGTDSDGDALTYAVFTSPIHGVLTVNPDGTWIYIPDSNFFGSDTFSIQVSDGAGGTAVSTVSVTVTPVNDPPVVPDYMGSTAEDTIANGRVTATDADGNPLTYSLFTAPTDGTAVVNADGTWTYTPNPNFHGDDRFTVLVSDGLGGTAVSTVTLTIVPVNDPPVTQNYNVSTPEDVAVNGKVVATDVDGDILVYSLSDLPLNGTAVVNGDGSWTYTPNGNFSGADTFSVLVDDGQGGTAISTLTLTVVPVNDPPQVPDYTVSTPEDIPASGTVVAADADGDVLTYSLLTPPVNGVAVVNGDGTWTYSPNGNFNGSETFSVLVSDGQGGTAVSTLHITVVPVNDPPSVPNYAVTGPEDTPLAGSVIGFDIDGDPLTYSLFLNAVHGTVAVNADGTWTYTPNSNFTGDDAFSVQVSDGQGGTAVSTVSLTITPVNDPPVIPDYTVITSEDTAISGTAVGSDVDGDPLAYSLYTVPSNGTAVVNSDGTWTYTPFPDYNGPDLFSIAVSDPSGATAVSRISITVLAESDAIIVPDYTIAAIEDTPVSGQVVAIDVDGNPVAYSLLSQATNGTAVVNADGTWTYTPNANFSGIDSFSVLVTDPVTGNTAISVIALNVAPVNDPPTVPDYAVSTPEDTPLAGTVVGSDLDGDILTYSALTLPTHGALSVNAGGTWLYTPDQNFFGSDTFSVQVSDGRGGTAVSTVNVTITPVNDPPTVPGYSASTPEDTPVNGKVVGADIDGNPLSYSLLTPPTNGSAVVNADGSWIYTPGSNFYGADSFTVQVSDGLGGTAVSTISITIVPVNDFPVVGNYTVSTSEDVPVSGTVVASDPDGDILSYGIFAQPSNGSVIVNTDGTWTYMPNANFNGSDTFSVLVEDNHGGTAVSTISVTVVPVNDPPVVPDYAVSTPEDIAVNGAVVASDVDDTLLAYSLLTPPSDGVAVVNADGTWVYTPNANFTGNDAFTVLVSDPGGATSVSTIIITILPVNDPPTVPDYSASTPEDTAVGGTIIGNDIDGDVLTYSLFTQAINGTAVVNTGGTWTYTPNGNFHGSDTFSVLVDDGRGGTAVSTVRLTILAVNDPPVVPDYTVATAENTAVSAKVTATDADGDVLSYSLYTPPANGTAVVNGDGTWTYTPNANYAGPDLFSVLVSDPSGATAVSTINITVLAVSDQITVPNYADTILENSSASGQVEAVSVGMNPLVYSLLNAPANGTAVVNADGTWTYTPAPYFFGADSFSVLVTDTVTGNVALSLIQITVLEVNYPPTVPDYAVSVPEDTPVNGTVVGSDVDGDVLTYSLASGPSNGTAAVNSDGTWTYTPNLNYTGADTFTVLVDDSHGGTAASTINITILPVNDPPVAPDYAVSTAENSFVTGRIIATDPDGDALTYSLFTAPTDGTAVVNPDGTWTYTPTLNFNGVDVFTVLVEDGAGGTAISTVNVTVTPVNNPPVTQNYNVSTPEDVAVTGTVTATDPDRDPLTYSLLTPPTDGTAAVNPNGMWTYTPNPNFNGVDTFSVLVSDGQGGTTFSTININILAVNDPPAVPDYAASTPEDIPVNGRVTGTDADGDVLAYSLLTAPTDGTVLVNADGTWTYTPNSNFNGADMFTVLVDDGRGGTAVSGITITVLPVNDPPTVPDYAVSGIEDSPVTGTVIGNDADGDLLTYSLLTPPIFGTVTVNPDGTWLYTPAGNFSGNDTFSVLVGDGRGGTAISAVVVTILPVNDPPVAPDYSVTTPENTAVSSRVAGTDPEEQLLTYSLYTSPNNGFAVVNPDGTWMYTPGNDYTGPDLFSILVSDPQGGTAVSRITITVVAESDEVVVPNYTVTTPENVPTGGQVEGVSLEGNPLQYGLLSSPGNGTAAVNPDGTWTYTPNPFFEGADSFTVLVTDTVTGNTAVSLIQITVSAVNHSPEVPDYTVTTAQGSQISGTVIGTDPDGDILNYSLLTPPANGSAAVNSNGTWTYVPTPGFNGPDSFQVLVDDGQGGTAVSVISITVTPVNRPPSVPNYSVSTPRNVWINGAVVGTDPDGDLLTYSLLTASTDGTATVNSDGSWTYEPNAGFVGADVFTVLVDDGHGGTAISTVLVNVIFVNTPPTVPNYTASIPEDVPVNGTVVGTDPDGDVLVYSLFTNAINGTVIVNGDGTWAYTPAGNFNGTDSFSVLVSDSRGGTAVSTVSITVISVNDNPVVGNYSVSTAQNTAVSGTVVATDPDGDILTYSLLTPPVHGTAMVNPDGTWTYTPAPGYSGPDSFSILVSDPHGGTAASTITVTVVPVSDRVTVPNYTASTLQDTPVNGQVAGTSLDGNPLAYSLLSAPTNGAAVVNSDGTWAYTPGSEFRGVDSFSVLVTDTVTGNTAVSVVTITVIPVNRPPVVPDYNVSTPENAQLNGTVRGSDPDGDLLTYNLQTPAQNGTILVNANGTWVYTPNTNFVGADSFTVLVSDGQGGTAVSTVNITVVEVNIPPTVPDYTVATFQNTPADGRVEGEDVNGNPLTYSLFTPPANGEAAVNSDGTWTYTPDLNYTGTDTFSVLVSDGRGGTAVSVIRITVEGQTDVITVPDYDVATQANVPVSGQVQGTSSLGRPLTYSLLTPPLHGPAIVNPDGTWTYTPALDYVGTDAFSVLVSDGLGATAVSVINITIESPVDIITVPDYDVSTTANVPVSGQVQGTSSLGRPLTYSLLTPPLHGTAIVNPDGTWTYTPALDYVGADAFSVLVSDGLGATVVSIVRITVGSPADVITVPDYDVSTTANVPVSGQVQGASSLGRPLTYSLLTPPLHGTAIVSPYGTWIYEPDTGYVGPDVFTVEVSNDTDATALSRVSITVEGGQDVITVPNYTRNTTKNVQVSGRVEAVSSLQRPLTYSLLTAPLKGTAVVGPDGRWIYTPEFNFVGQDVFSVLVSDELGNSAVSTITINVLPSRATRGIKISKDIDVLRMA